MTWPVVEVGLRALGAAAPINDPYYDGPVTDSDPTILPVLLGGVGVLILAVVFGGFVLWLTRRDRSEREAGRFDEESPFFETRENPYEDQYRRPPNAGRGTRSRENDEDVSPHEGGSQAQ